MSPVATLWPLDELLPARPARQELIAEFFCPGKAAPGGSKTGRIARTKDGRQFVSMRDAGKNNKPWRAVVSVIAAQNFSVPLACPVRIDTIFVRQRPADHFNKNGELRTEYRSAANTKIPDADKLRRAVMDAMTGIVYRDDSICVCGWNAKIYGDNPGVHVRVFRV